MKLPKKPKRVKYPKAPKNGASLATVKNYLRKLAEIDKKNAERTAAYNKKISERAQAKRLLEQARAKKSKPKLFALKAA